METRPVVPLVANTMNVDEKRLSGSERSLADALKTTDLIVIATVSHVSSPGADWPGTSDYQIEIHVEKILRGDASEKMTIEVDVRDIPPDRAESVPKIGDRLLFLLKKKNKQAVKILFPTAQNIKVCS